MYLCILCIYVFMYFMYFMYLCIYVFMYLCILCIYVFYVFYVFYILFLLSLGFKANNLSKFNEKIPILNILGSSDFCAFFIITCFLMQLIFTWF